MSTFKCPVCEKDRPKNYCPECARILEPTETTDKAAGGGDVIRGSWALCAAKVRLNPLRYLWLKPVTRVLCQAWLVLAVPTILAFVMKWWVVGVLLLVLLLPLSAMLWWISRRVAEIYQHAALTPGMIVSRAPLEYISLANMDTGAGVDAYAVKRIAIPRLPCHSEEVGSMFPCVSGFQDGSMRNRWGDFDPQPLSLGTGNIKLIEARRTKLGDEAFAQLREVFDRGQYPTQAGQLYWLDGTDAPKSPPPMPPMPPPLPQG